MIDWINVNKPTKKEIQLWVENRLNDESMKEVTAGLLIYKDNEIQDHLQKCLIEEVKEYSEETSPLFSKFVWAKEIMSDIFSSYKRVFDDMSLFFSFSDEPLIPLLLGSKEKPKKEEPFYTISAQSNSDLKILIQVPKGKYLITTIFFNSKEEMGFMYPNFSSVLRSKNLADFIVEGEQSVPLIHKGDYTFKESEVNFIVTRCPAQEKYLNAFVSCVQKIEELSVVRWLRYIQKNNQGDFNIVSIKFSLDK